MRKSFIFDKNKFPLYLQMATDQNSYLNLNYWEKELKKRGEHPYRWGTKQTDALDQLTKFIYQTHQFTDLLELLNSISHQDYSRQQIFDYALNRWYNFHSAMCVEAIFAKNPIVSKAQNSYNKEKDFFIENIPFDLKTTVFPKKITLNWEATKGAPKELAKWLYIHQSSQGRFHIKNRLFIVLNGKNQLHWKMKAELTLIKQNVEAYLQDFHVSKLIKLTYSEGFVFTDVIFVSK